jgi:excisionase family DNA binding protein
VELKDNSGDSIGRIAYSPAEVALAVGLSRKAIYRAIASGELRAARVCGKSRLMIPAEEARAWVARNLLEPRSGEQFPASVTARPHARRTPLKDALRKVA